MNQPAAHEKPVLKPGCRLGPGGNAGQVLLIPEGALRLQGPGRRILELCDGNRNLGEIIGTLQAEFPSAGADRIETEVLAFLSGLREKGALEFL